MRLLTSFFGFLLAIGVTIYLVAPERLPAGYGFQPVPVELVVESTLAGELVDTINHYSTLDDGKAFWDLRTKDNMNIAYGLYIYHVDSAEGSFIGKFAVIK